MADDRHYVPGDFYRICERTGFKVRAGKTMKEWTGRIVRVDSYEERQPQDFVRGVTDDQNVPEPRPRPGVDLSQGPPVVTITTFAGAGSTTLSLSSTASFLVNYLLFIILDNKDTFFSRVTSISGPSTLTIGTPLPYSVSIGNEVTAMPGVSLGRSFSSGFSTGFS